MEIAFHCLNLARAGIVVGMLYGFLISLVGCLAPQLRCVLRGFFSDISGKVKVAAAGGGSALILATALLMEVEGLKLIAYLDSVGIPTICYGETEGVKMGQKKTAEECTFMLKAKLVVIFALIDTTVRVNLPETRRAAIASFIYNIGPGAFIKSTFLKLLNKGETQQACEAMRQWVCVTTAKGKGAASGQCASKLQNKRVEKGLINRREKEVGLCLIGI